MSIIAACSRVSKRYADASGRARYALRDVTAEIEAGRILAVTGRSGSGKSTLLALLAGIDVPSEGRVTVLDKTLGSLSDEERTRLRRDDIGLVFQFFHLLPHLTVIENVLLPAMIAGDRGSGPHERASTLLTRVGLADRRDDPAGRLSGGEMQRVAVCRALVRNPRLILADEPTGNLDDATGRVVMDEMIGLVREAGSTLVFVTHSRELSRRANLVWRLTSGVLET